MSEELFRAGGIGTTENIVKKESCSPYLVSANMDNYLNTTNKVIKGSKEKKKDHTAPTFSIGTLPL